MTKILAVALGLALVGGSGFAFAQNVSDQQIRQNLEGQGYRDIHISRHEKSHIDVRASKNGKAEQLAVNPQTGQVSPDTDNDRD